MPHWLSAEVRSSAPALARSPTNTPSPSTAEPLIADQVGHHRWATLERHDGDIAPRTSSELECSKVQSRQREPERQIKRISFFKRAEGMTPEEFQRRWCEAYGPAVAASTTAQRYVQAVPRLGGYQNGKEPEWDGIDMCWFGTLADARMDKIYQLAGKRAHYRSLGRSRRSLRSPACSPGRRGTHRTEPPERSRSASASSRFILRAAITSSRGPSRVSRTT